MTLGDIDPGRSSIPEPSREVTDERAMASRVEQARGMAKQIAASYKERGFDTMTPDYLVENAAFDGIKAAWNLREVDQEKLNGHAGLNGHEAEQGGTNGGS